MKINIQKLKQDIHEIEAEIAAIKQPLRTTWTRPMGKEQWDLITLRSKATDLYILRAWNRGKLHRQNPPEAIRVGSGFWSPEEHAQAVWERLAPDYEIEEGEIPCLKTGSDGV
jgi:hypothetical protein